jgi:hypothetical protein
MPRALAPLFDWFKSHPDFLIAAGVVSGVMFVGTLVAIPLLIIRIPADYFLGNKVPEPEGKVHPLSRFLLKALKNILGVILLIAGLAMLVLPGQGLLTILIGLILVNFPGKRKLECRLIRNRSIISAVNYIRAKAKRPLLRTDLPGCPG